MHLGEGRLRQGGLELVGTLGHPALVDQQVVGEERQALGGGRRTGGRGSTAISRAAQKPRHLLVQLVQGVEAEVAAARGREPGEDLPVRPADPGGGAERADALAAALPIAHMPVTLEERRGRQEHARVRLQVTELERLDDDGGDVLQRAAGERGVGGVAEGVDADQVEDVEFVFGSGSEDVGRAAADGLDHHGSPDGLKLGALLGDVQPAAAGAEGRVHARPQRAVIARTARDPRESGAVRPRRGDGAVRGPLLLSESGAGKDEPALPRGRERCAGARRIAARRDRGERLDLAAGTHEHVLGDVMQPRSARGHDHDPCATGRRLAQAQVQDRHLLLGIEPDDHDRGGSLDLAIRHALGTGRGQHLGRAAVRCATVVQVVGPQHRARELRQRVRVLVEQAPAREHADTRAVARVGDRGQRLAERSGLEPVVAHQRRRDPAGRVVVAEREPPLVAQPGVVDVGVVAREQPHDLAAPLVARGRRTRALQWRQTLSTTRQVERPRDEPVGRGGQRADRADLHDVARERRSRSPRRRRSRPAPPLPARRARGTGHR